MEHDRSSLSWRATMVAYWGKVVCTVLAAPWRIAVVSRRVLQTPDSLALIW